LSVAEGRDPVILFEEVPIGQEQSIQLEKSPRVARAAGVIWLYNLAWMAAIDLVKSCSSAAVISGKPDSCSGSAHFALL
jgi:hypothetical protein